MRATFADIGREMTIDASNALFVRGKEIGLVYFRTGYQLSQYEASEGVDPWRVRAALENSMAIKCPSIDVHLTTFKKYQQAFSNHDFLEQVTKDKALAARVSGLFKGIWSLEDYGKKEAEVNRVFADALANPQKYVLKPQKEGGGNNFFDEEMRQQLANFENDPSVATYLLMERINPPKVQALHVREGRLSLVDSLSELGIYSVVFLRNQRDGAQILENRVIG